MANLFDLLRNLGNKTQQIQPIQLAENGEVDIDKTLQLQKEQPRNLAQHLFGRELGVDVDTTNVNPETGENQITTERVTKFQPGFFNNLASGARENFATGFAANNLTDNTVNGVKKGIGYRLGEGLGTLARIGESPLGRGLIVSGLVGLTGGNPLQAMAYGATAGVGNQGNRMRDKVYRQQLNEAGLDTSNIRGYVTDDVYKNIVAMKQIQDNAEYRNALLETQRYNQGIANKIAQDKLDYQRQQDAIQNQQRNRDLDIKEKRYSNGLNKLSSKDLTTYRDNLSTLSNIDAGLKLIDENPNAYSLVKGALPAWATNRIDPKGISTRTQIDNITAVYRKWLTGAQMSDAERKAYERFLPAPTDNYETIKAKLQGMRDSIERQNNILINNGNEYQNMTDEIVQDSLGIL